MPDISPTSVNAALVTSQDVAPSAPEVDKHWGGHRWDAGTEDDVVGLDVAMDEALQVDVLQARQQTLERCAYGSLGNGRAEAGRERLADDTLHHFVGPPHFDASVESSDAVAVGDSSRDLAVGRELPRHLVARSDALELDRDDVSRRHIERLEDVGGRSSSDEGSRRVPLPEDVFAP